MKWTPDRWASGKKKKTAKKKGKSRKKKPLILAAIWLIITSVCTILALTIGGTLYFVGALLSGLATVMVAIATFDPNSVETGRQTSTPKTPIRRGNGNSSGIRKPVSQRKQTCSARCRNSLKPLTDCRCVCGGKTHGIKHRDP